MKFFMEFPWIKHASPLQLFRLWALWLMDFILCPHTKRKASPLHVLKRTNRHHYFYLKSGRSKKTIRPGVIRVNETSIQWIESKEVAGLTLVMAQTFWKIGRWFCALPVKSLSHTSNKKYRYLSISKLKSTYYTSETSGSIPPLHTKNGKLILGFLKSGLSRSFRVFLQEFLRTLRSQKIE